MFQVASEASQLPYAISLIAGAVVVYYGFMHLVIRCIFGVWL